MQRIGRRIFQVWVGTAEPPLKWMQTWKDKHPDWEYILIDNDYLYSHSWINKKHIMQYYKEKKWHGVADLVRYEMQYNYGGFIAPADSQCLRPLDELIDEVYNSGCDCFTCSESDLLPDYVVPILGATKGNELIKTIIDKLHKIESVEGTKPWKTTGNKFIGKVIKGYERLKLYPYYYFVPEHYSGSKYEGTDKVFCTQEFGTTRNCYDKGR